MGAEPRTEREALRITYTQADIADVQRRAVAAYKAELAEKVRALPGVTLLTEKATGFGGFVIERAAVLTLIEPTPLTNYIGASAPALLEAEPPQTAQDGS